MDFKSIYIAGPMSGIPDYNFPAFQEAAERGRRMGLIIVSPAELDADLGIDTRSALPEGFLRKVFARDVDYLCNKCGSIALLPGWENSVGARIELRIAQMLDMSILDARTFEPFTEELPDTCF